MTPALLLVPLYAVADRFAGGGWPALDAKLPGRAAFWGALACAGAGYLLAGAYGALMGLAFLIWRTPGWDIFGGSMTPTTAKGYVGTFLRHLIAAPCAAAAAYWTAGNPLLAGAAFGGFAGVAILLAAAYGARNASGDVGNMNAFIELARGAAFGAAVMAGVVFAHAA